MFVTEADNDAFSTAPRHGGKRAPLLSEKRSYRKIEKPPSPKKGRERSRGTTLIDYVSHSPLCIRNVNDAPWPTSFPFGMELQGDLHSFAYAGLPPSPARCNKR